ncbi:MAG: ATP-binding protein [Dehalococcoidia bacterium]
MSALRRSLGARFFLSHLVVLLVAGAVLAVVAMALAPQVASLQIAHLGPMIHPAGMMGGPMMTGLDQALALSYRDAIVAALLAGGGAALLAALAASVLAAGRLAAPLHSTAAAARRIGGGNYDERLPEQGIDDLDSLARSFNEMAAALAAAEQKRLELVGDVAHELRTPIATLDGYLEGLQDGVITADGATWTLLRAETRRLATLVAELNDLSRADAGRLRLLPVPTSVEAITTPALQRVAADALGRRLQLDADVPIGLPVVLADVDRAVQVLTNLLTNAVRYTDPGGVVRLAALADGDGVRIDVTDTGIGIAPEHLRQVFDRFYRVDKSRSRQHGGTGIGLTIALALAEAMGGRLAARSPGAGKGSTFSFWLSSADRDVRPAPLLPRGSNEHLAVGRPSPGRNSSRTTRSSAENAD